MMATAMAATGAERAVLEEEFRWLLHSEVHAVLKQLQDILKEASLRFTLPGSGTESPAKQENFILGSCGEVGVQCILDQPAVSQQWEEQPMAGRGASGRSRLTLTCCSTDQVKGVLTLQGDALSQADVNLKMPRNNQLLHLAFREDKQWKLQQIQDARNHVSQAIYLLAHRDESYQFKTGAEVLKRMFAPTLPSDLLVNVYINLNKLCLTVYQLHALQPNSTKNFRPAGGAVLHSPGAMFSASSSRTRQLGHGATWSPALPSTDLDLTRGLGGAEHIPSILLTIPSLRRSPCSPATGATDLSEQRPPGACPLGGWLLPTECLSPPTQSSECYLSPSPTLPHSLALLWSDPGVLIRRKDTHWFRVWLRFCVRKVEPRGGHTPSPALQGSMGTFGLLVAKPGLFLLSSCPRVVGATQLLLREVVGGALSCELGGKEKGQCAELPCE
ncbi:protein rogdi homolog isoform X3 [Heterocephalus glaber]|uniref:Protein rogdi homolog n=1 Tax=Heterocephalus glaber TaxID=10181 RepID=A0AAX6RW57_HETGA|nr:protein rogdi homolog isoform X3 [Heterocephalus glaber]